MTDWLTGPAGTNVPVLAGMVLTVVLCWRLLARPVFVDPSHDGAGSVARAVAPFVFAQVLIAAGFWLSRSTDTIWIMMVVAAIIGLTAVSLAVLARAARRASATLSGPTVAAVLLTALLNEIGALLLVRLVIVSDPDSPFGAGLAADAWLQARDAVGYPVVVAAAALAVAWLATSTGTGRGAVARVRRTFDGRVARWRTRRSELPGVTGRTIAGGSLVALALFVAPVFGPTTGSAHLTILGVATPQAGLIVLIAVLAAMVARYGHRFNPTGPVDVAGFLRRLFRGQVSRGDARVMWVDLRHMLLPVGLFVLVAATCAVRRDFGTVIPALAATFGVTWAATSDSVRRSPDLTEDGTFSPATVWRRLTRSLSVYRVFIWAAVILIGTAGTAVLLGTSYIQERATVWADPWAYRWDAGCAVPDGAQASPTGEIYCQQSLAANLESQHSQVARALSAVADGGLWGRGLRDTASGMVPAGQTDFILAVVWNKLGGVAVLLISILVVMLGAALRQATRSSRARAPDGRAGRRQGQLWFAFFAAGLASMIVGNYLFVFLATVNVIPHSGIPAPFLSRGGQWTLSLLAGIAIVVLIASRTGTAIAASKVPSVRMVEPPTLARPGRLAVVPLTVCLACVAVITVVPYQKPGFPLPTAYDETRPVCRVRDMTREGLTSAPPDPARCSTDRLAFNRTRVEVRLGDHTVLLQNRDTAAWTFEGTPEAGLTLADLSGLLKVGNGGVGLLDQSYDDVTQETAGTTLAKRLSAPSGHPEADGLLDLTIDPALQHALVDSLRSDGTAGSPPMAGGVVVIEAATGHVLASATAPGYAEPVRADSAEAEATEAAKQFLKNRKYYGPLAGERLDGSAEDATCQSAADSGEANPDCWRWSVIIPGASDNADSLAALRDYVGGDLDADLPLPHVNRAVGKWYGFGSTFKVIIAAAYLSQGGRPDDKLDAPLTIPLAPEVVIHNAGGGACPGGETGSITLARALAVSCNTAFVMLAARLGWPAIAEQARKFGMTVGTCQPKKPAFLAHRGAGTVESCVPDDVDGVAIGNNALGGQDVQGTPMAMATVLAAIANGGTAVAPTLLRSVRHPGSGEVEHPVGRSMSAVDPEVADTLTRALSETSVDGTAEGLDAAVKAKLWVKTGTHEVVPAGTRAPPGQYVIVHSWLVGFVNTATHGPVAFAVVIEANDEKAGAARTRAVVQRLCAGLGV